jgi:flavin-dependent amine oxidoreductase
LKTGGSVRQFDLAVVGTDFGGLASAALLSSAGKRSILCTPASSLAGAVGAGEKDGFIFCAGPSLTYGFEQGGEFHRLITDLGLKDMAPSLAPVYQVVLPDRRLTVSASQDETFEELRREFPREIQTITRFYRDLKNVSEKCSRSRISAYFSKRTSAAAFIGKYGLSREFRAFLEIQALFFFYQPVQRLSLATLMTLCTTRPFNSRGLLRRLADQMLSIILDKGGDIQYGETAPEIAFRDGRTISVKTTRGITETGIILLSTPVSRTPVQFLGIRDEVVPVGMAQDVLSLPDYAKPNEFISLSLSGKNDGAAAPRGMRSLAATFHTEMQSPDRQMLTGHIGHLIPFLDDYLLFSEEYHPAGAASVPATMKFKPVRTGRGEPLLFKASRRNVYLLHLQHHSSLEQLPAVRRFVKHVS